MNSIFNHTAEQRYPTLSPTQINDFDQNGYLIIRQALDRERIHQLVHCGERLIASNTQRFRRDSGQSDGFRNVIALDEAFLGIIDNPKIFPLIVQLMGPHIQLHTSDLIWKSPDPRDSPAHYRNPGWHRDIARVTRDLEHDRMPRLEIKAAYFLSDCSKPQSGQTLVAAGSHRWRENWTPSAAQPDPPTAIEASLQAGDVLLFENRTWHAGGANKTTQTRKTLMIGYSHDWMRCDDYDTQAPALLERCNPLQRCLLEQINCSFDEQERFRPCIRKSVIERWAEEHHIHGPVCH